MRCKNCGQELTEHAKFCKWCGTEVITDSGGKSQESLAAPEYSQDFGPDSRISEEGPKTRKKGKGIYMLLVFLLTVLLAAGAGGVILGVKIWRARQEGSFEPTFFVFGGKKNQEDEEDEESEKEEKEGEDDRENEREEEKNGEESRRNQKSGDEKEETLDREKEREEETATTAAGARDTTAASAADITSAPAVQSTTAAETVPPEPTSASESAAASEEMIEEELNLQGAVPVTMDHVKFITATSSLSEYNMTHSPERLYDGDLSSAWVEGVSGQGIGESVTFSLDETCLVSGFCINAGYQKSSDLYKKNSRPSQLRVSIPGCEDQIYDLEDEFGAQNISLVWPMAANEITFTIEAVYPGSKYEDTVISELTVY